MYAASKLSENVPTKSPAHISSGYDLSERDRSSSNDCTISCRQYGAIKPAMTFAHSNSRASRGRETYQRDTGKRGGGVLTIKYNPLFSAIEIFGQLPAPHDLLPECQLACRRRGLSRDFARVIGTCIDRVRNEEGALRGQSHVLRSI